jgi:hypothetical protein
MTDRRRFGQGGANALGRIHRFRLRRLLLARDPENAADLLLHRAGPGHRAVLLIYIFMKALFNFQDPINSYTAVAGGAK